MESQIEPLILQELDQIRSLLAELRLPGESVAACLARVARQNAQLLEENCKLQETTRLQLAALLRAERVLDEALRKNTHTS